MMSKKLPVWLRFILLVGVVILATGAGLFAYRYFTYPVTLTVAVGSIDGEAAKAMSAIANEIDFTLNRSWPTLEWAWKVGGEKLSASSPHLEQRRSAHR